MIGKEILGYHVDEKIGSGGFGTVYKVSKTNAAGTYIRALKHITLPTKKQYASVLNSMGGDYAKADDYFASALNDIVNEIKILSTLSESGVNNIVRYYENDIIETSSPKTYDIYILMEYLTPFTDYIDGKDFMVKDVIGLGKDILRALVSCHDKNIIHRDIKDDNIFVSPDGTYKLGDFGVSKALKDKSRAESVKGTPNFIAPEVYLGKEKYDDTVDVYSLGIVLYKLLNKMRHPFLPMFPAPYSTADEDAAFEARMRGQVPELPICAQNELGKVILKAIMPRAQRYNSAQEFLRDLEAVELNLSDDELVSVACEVLMKNEEKNVTNNSIKSSRNKSSDETIGMVYSSDEEETSVAENRNLFETFAETPKASINIPKDYKSDGPKVKTEINANSEKKINVRKLLVFGIPPVLLLIYIGFYMLLIPALYGETLSFFDWIFADVNHIAEVLKDINNILVPTYIIVLLVVLQYVILGAFLASLFFVARELHNPRVKVDESVKYTGKAPQIMLENIYAYVKEDASSFDRNTVDTLRTVVDSMKYSKAFGVSDNTNIVSLEQEICRLIDDLQDVFADDIPDRAKQASVNVMMLKQKIALRDTMLKK